MLTDNLRFRRFYFLLHAKKKKTRVAVTGVGQCVSGAGLFSAQWDRVGAVVARPNINRFFSRR